MRMSTDTYMAIMDCIDHYYGHLSDQWWAIGGYGEKTAAELYPILKNTPYVTTLVSESGEIVGYECAGWGVEMSAAEATAAAAANAYNSNALTAAAAARQFAVPGNMTLTQTTPAAVEVASGATKVSGAAAGSKVATALGHVGTWVVGAGVGMKLGVWIDAGAYAAYKAGHNHGLWDTSAVMEYCNPERWKESKITNWLYDYSGYDDFVAMFNADDEQLYIDENLFALMAQYINGTGAFSTSAGEVTLDDTSPLFHPNNYVMPVNLSNTSITLRSGSGLASQTHMETQNEQGVVHCAIIGPSNDDVVPYFFSDSYFEVKATGQYSFTTQATPVTKDGITYYVVQEFGSYGLLDGVRNPGAHLQNCGWDLQYMMEYGTYTPGGVEGIHPYDTMPTGITDQMTPEQIVALLKQQYPQIWDDAIKQGTLNEDGTITDRVYVPIAVPTGGTEGEPTTDPQHTGAVDPSNPTQTETIVNIINPTPNPTETPENPTTGTGNTPTVVLPTGSADALYKIYNPTNAQVKSFGAWLWSPNFVDQILKMFNDPMQAIISLHKIYAVPHTGGTANIKVGYLDSGVSSKWVDEQYIQVDCGFVQLNEINASILDYDPFTELRLYLPFIGIVRLDTADVMRGKIGVKYNIDVITGVVVAMVTITRDNGAGGVVYQYTGSMAEMYPLSSGSYMGIATGILGIAAGIAGTVATGGAAAPAVLGAAAGAASMHTKVEHSNGFSGNAGAMACKKPYLIILRQQGALANNLESLTGWPSNSYVKLSQCSGLTRVKDINLSIPGATDQELIEIETLLKGGVLI